MNDKLPSYVCIYQPRYDGDFDVIWGYTLVDIAKHTDVLSKVRRGFGSIYAIAEKTDVNSDEVKEAEAQAKKLSKIEARKYIQRQIDRWQNELKELK